VRPGSFRAGLVCLALGAGLHAPGPLPLSAQDATIRNLAEAAEAVELPRWLAAHEGRWESEGSYWLPSGEERPARGTIEARRIMGGLFVESTATGTVEGYPVEGRSVLGYDRVTERVNEVWFDTLGTGIYRYEGTCEDQACRVRVEEAEFTDPVWGERMTSRVTVEWFDEDSYRHTAVLVYEDGRTVPQVEYTARRVR